MKISNILLAISFMAVIACGGKKNEDNHGHSHGTETGTHSHEESADEHGHSHADGDHDHDNHHEQEEFTIKEDSVEETGSTHTHDDGSTHQDH